MDVKDKRIESAETSVIQIWVSRTDKDILREYAKRRGTTVAGLVRPEIWQLVARIVAETEVAA